MKQLLTNGINMIYKATMTHGKRKASVWLVGKRYSGGLTREQEFHAHHKLMRETRCYDEFICTLFQVMEQGRLEISHAANCY